MVSPQPFAVEQEAGFGKIGAVFYDRNYSMIEACGVKEEVILPELSGALRDRFPQGPGKIVSYQ